MKDLHALDKYRVVDKVDFLVTGLDKSKNGCFKVFIDGRSFFVVATNSGGWDHISVSPCSKKRKTCPTWDEMCAIKDMFFEPEEECIQYHPKHSEYVNLYPYCLHIWRPNDGREILMPPTSFV